MGDGLPSFSARKARQHHLPSTVVLSQTTVLAQPLLYYPQSFNLSSAHPPPSQSFIRTGLPLPPTLPNPPIQQRLTVSTFAVCLIPSLPPLYHYGPGRSITIITLSYSRPTHGDSRRSLRPHYRASNAASRKSCTPDATVNEGYLRGTTGYPQQATRVWD